MRINQQQPSSSRLEHTVLGNNNPSKTAVKASRRRLNHTYTTQLARNTLRSGFLYGYRLKDRKPFLMTLLTDNFAVLLPCNYHPGFSRAHFYRELKKGLFAEDLKLARECGADALAEQIIEIIDNRQIDLDGAKMMADYRLKLLSCWWPKKYGQVKINKPSTVR